MTMTSSLKKTKMPDTMHRVRFVERNPNFRLCFVFSCDNTCNLNSVDSLLSELRRKLDFGILVFKHNVSDGPSQTSEMCESVIPDQLPMDFAIFVVQASEPWLSINEDIDGKGYAKIYRALLKATGGRVIVVITGDDNYIHSVEEQTSVLSRWARRNVSSQFKEEFLDGRKSFIFSWNKEHRPIHEEAMLHFLDPGKNGEIFVPEPKVEPAASEVDPTQVVKSQGRSETDVKPEAERDSSDIQTRTSEGQKTQTRGEREKESVHHPLQTDSETEPQSFEILSLSDEQQGTEEHMDTSGRPEGFVDVKHTDVPEPETPAHHSQAVDTDAASPREDVAILYRVPSDIPFIKDVFGGFLLTSAPPFFSRSPLDFNTILTTQAMRSCYIIVEAGTIVQELLKESSAPTPYLDLLRTARNAVETKVVIILCNDRSKVTRDDEDTITARIWELLDDKGVVLWSRGSKKSLRAKRSSFDINRSQSRSDHEGTVWYTDLTSETTEELVLKTRLRHGKISYDEQDVEVRLEGWTAPQVMANHLWMQWNSTKDAELLVYRELNTSNKRTVVNKVKGMNVAGVMQSVTQFSRPKKTEELILKTRLRHGKISYDEQDVEVRLQGWTAAQEMANNLWRKWYSTNDAELLVYRELNTGNERTVVNRVKGMSVAGVMQSVGSTVGSFLSSSLRGSSNTL